MGRVSRYKRIAADDPFAPRRAKVVDETIDFAPEPKDERDDAGGMTRSIRNLMKAQERVKKNQTSTKRMQHQKELRKTVQRYQSLSEKAQQRPVNKPGFDFVSQAQKSAAMEFRRDQHKPNMHPEFEAMKEDESYHEFTRRLREETAEKTKKRVLADTHKQEKRKEYYEKKRDQKKRKRENINSDDEADEEEGKIGDFSKLATKAPKFGEQAQAPPKFSVLPRHSAKVDLAIAKRMKALGVASTPIMAFKEKKKVAMARLSDFDDSHLTSADGNSSSSAPTASSSTSQASKTEMEALRQRVQEQYRALKEKRLAEGRIRSGGTDKTARKRKSPNLTFSQDDMERFQEMRPESKKSIKKARQDQRWLRRK